MDKLRRDVLKNFRLSGFSLTSEALNYLVQALSDFPESQHIIWIDKILERLDRTNLNSALLGKNEIDQAMKECGRNSGDTQDWLHIISAFDVPRLVYDNDRKKFLLDEKPKEVLGKAEEKIKVFRSRYALLHQRVLHHPLFTPSVVGVRGNVEDGEKKYELKTIEFLIGSTANIGEVVVLGMITQLKEGKYFLEDLTGFVEMDMSETSFHNGFYTENCFVLAQGNYEFGVFHVTAIGPPIDEDAAQTKVYFGMTNFFGGPSIFAHKEMLEITENNQVGHLLVMISDLHLDNIKTLRKLRVLFEGYNEHLGGMFILMGNFLSDPIAAQKPVALRDAFKNLADLIIEFPNIHSKFTFVIVPGPTDAGFVNILPRPPFAKVITDYFQEKVPNAVFMTNPCRIRYCTKEIIVFREDSMTKMVRNSLYHPKTEPPAQTFVKTIIAQAHLCPLPLHTCPVYWSYDHALFLYPIPTMVVIADKGEPFYIKTKSCHFLNPGSFLINDGRFKTYSPSEDEVEECCLPPDAE